MSIVLVAKISSSPVTVRVLDPMTRAVAVLPTTEMATELSCALLLELSALPLALVTTSEVAEIIRAPLAVMLAPSTNTSAFEVPVTRTTLRTPKPKPLESTSMSVVAVRLMFPALRVAPAAISTFASASEKISSIPGNRPPSTANAVNVRSPSVPEASSKLMVLPGFTLMVSLLMVRSMPGLTMSTLMVTVSSPSCPLIVRESDGRANVTDSNVGGSRRLL